MKKLFILVVCSMLVTTAWTQPKKKQSGNPLFAGWYADPEAVIFGKEYWIYPTF